MTRAHLSRRLAPPWSVHGALAAAQAGFALFPVLGKLALATIPALPLAGLRVACAALLLEAFRRLAAAEEIAPPDRKRILLYAVLGVSLNQVFFILGLSLTTAINTSILTATIPVFTFAAAVLLGRETLTARPILGLVLAGAGALVLVNVQNFDWHSRYARGDLLLLANALCYSFYLVLSRPLLAHYRVTTVVSQLFLYGAAPILLFTAPALVHFNPSAVSAASWASFAGVVVFCTVLPYFLNSWALARAEASRVAIYVFLQPIIASLLAVLILKESFSPRTAIAALLIFAGLGVSIAPRRPPVRAIP